ncbi:MAG TPA: O-acetyl-ADP-ribose deacetylase [Acidimicrobiia bacterium]|nr:O-acetyl-ADP-ribose deacetylase [Acidimicrobiia bacterium]
MHVEVVQGDITAESVDAIVNAANEQLAAGGGVCGAIHRAGGPSIAEECRRIGHCPTGSAVATTAGNLPARFVIHSVGPVWHGGSRGEADLLASAYTSALDEAARVGASTIAFPAISTGIYGYPLKEATAVAVEAVRNWKGDGVDLVRFVCFDGRTFHAYRAALG